jgi:uncharacterized protein (DUF885 family)
MDNFSFIKRFIGLLFICSNILGCTNQKYDLQQLNAVISDYENHQAYDREKFPLGDFSEARFEQFEAYCSTLKKRLEAIKVENLPEDAQRSYQLLQFVLQDNMDYYRFRQHWNPLLSDAGFHNDLVYRVRPLASKEAALKYLAVLKAIPTFVEQNLALLQKGLEAGISQPKVIFKGYASTYEDHITPSAESNFYYSPFQQLPQSLDTATKDSLQRAAKELVENAVIPAFKDIKTFFEETYLPNTREAIGVSATPSGTAYYQNRINYYTTSTYSPEEIHTIGKQEVARIKKAMLDIMKEVQFKGDFKAFLRYLRTDPQFYATSPKALLTQAREISKRLDAQLPRFFKTLPRQPYGVAPVPDAIAPKYTGGRYIPASGTGTNPGYYWVNTYNLPSRPLYVLPALTAHEAVPGHHLQMALNAELPETIPQFRRNLYLSAYGEGWGLYTEKVAAEMGIYTTPYERFGQLTYEMWRACRLVVDTGIHALGWTREEAVAYMANNTALSLHEVNTEIDRYISWPGQALAYKIGELKILALRAKAEEALGDAFDIRNFHEALLQHGTLTLPLLEESVNAYIANP